MYLITTVAFFLSAFLLPDHGMAPHNVNKLLVLCAISAAVFPIIVIVLQKKLDRRLSLSATAS
jgi:hypothetical protein